MGQKKFAYRSLAVATLLALSTGGAQASGFSVPEISIGGLGASNAVVANHKMLGAVPYNRSLAVFHDGTTVSGGLMVVHAESEASIVAPNAPTTVDFQGRDNVLIPNLALTHQINDQLTLTFTSAVPLGLSTKYPAGAFSSLNNVPAPPLNSSPTKSQVEVIDVSPGLAFRINKDTALALGIDYYWVRKVAFDTVSVQNEGDGDAWGWNVSASHIAGPWSFGASFHSTAEADISGETTFLGTAFGGTTTTLNIPWRAQIGARYQINPALAIEGDISRTGWNSFDTLAIQTTSPAGTITSINQWKDANAYRLGGTYQLNDSTELRFGYTLDKTGMPDAYFSARVADEDRQLFSIGVEKQLGDGLAIEGGYMLVKFKDRSHRAAGFTTVGEPNGSLLYNGDYSSTVHLLGVGLSKRF